jgi:penicillin amidase
VRPNVNGPAQAEVRLFEMDILRRAATGRLAELLGLGYLLMDEVARRDGYTPAERARFVARLPKRDRRALEAYRDGVHAFKPPRSRQMAPGCRSSSGGAAPRP